jgi:hypothetical protein
MESRPDAGMRGEELRRLIDEWGEFPAESDADVGCLVDEILAALNEGAGADDLALVIQNEFFVHFGQPGPPEAIVSVAERVVSWWGSHA